jgi:DNA polymerase-1
VRERYGVDPAQVPDFVALRGDPSDRIPGAPGVGPGRAAAVLKKHGSLDAALQNGGFPTIADDLRTYLRMARLQYEAPIPDLPDAEPTWGPAAELVELWGHNALGKRLRDRAG